MDGLYLPTEREEQGEPAEVGGNDQTEAKGIEGIDGPQSAERKRGR